MLIDRHIGFDETDGFGIMGDLFQKELLALDSMEKKRIQVWINSPGGIVQDGYNIYNAILKTKTKVDTLCTGMAASIAGVIFQAGRNRVMADYAWLMYHDPYGGNDGDGLDTMRKSIATMVANRCGKTQDEVLKIMSKTSYITADEALENGLCDKVEGSDQQNKKRMSGISQPIAFWKEASMITNKLLPIKNKILTMSKVANKLNLNAEASEDAIVAEVDKMQTRITTLEGEAKTHLTEVENKGKTLAQKEEELKNAMEKCKALEEEVKDMKAKAKAKDDEDAKAKAATEEEKAKNMIEGYAKQGRIKNEEAIIKSWTTKAIADFDGVKNMLETLPLNKVSNKIEISKVEGATKLGSVVGNKMQELRTKGK